MKLKLFTLLVIAGLGFVGCSSDKKDDGTTDTMVVDTNVTPPVDTTMTDTTTVPVDSTKM